MCSFISSSSKLKPDLPFDRKPIKLFQKVGGCKRKKRVDCCVTTLASACCAHCRWAVCFLGSQLTIMTKNPNNKICPRELCRWKLHDKTCTDLDVSAKKLVLLKFRDFYRPNIQTTLSKHWKTNAKDLAMLSIPDRHNECFCSNSRLKWQCHDITIRKQPQQKWMNIIQLLWSTHVQQKYSSSRFSVQHIHEIQLKIKIFSQSTNNKPEKNKTIMQHK